jgi:multiple sugar transport system permease protein
VPAGLPARRNELGMKRRSGQRSAPYLFVAPATLMFGLFFALPIGYAAYLSFRKVKISGLGLGKGARTEVWAGLGNYTHAMHDKELVAGALRVLLYGAILVPIMLGLALLFALILDAQNTRLRTLGRLGIFLP